MLGYLVSADEIEEAARWRLRTLSPEQVDAGIEAVIGLLERGATLERDSTAVVDALADIDGGPGQWPVACSLLVLVAGANGDRNLLFGAGFEVLAAREQARRSSVPRTGDALDELIELHLTEVDGVTPHGLWMDFCDQAENNVHAVLADHDGDELRYQAHPHDEEPTPINYDAFRRRVQRIRKRMARRKEFSPALRQPPVSVAPDKYDGQHERSAA